MTLAPLLARIGWPPAELSRRLGHAQPRTVRYWLAGRNARGNPCAPPPVVLAWLQRVAVAVEGVGSCGS